MIDTKMYTVKDIAKILNVHWQTVRNYLKKGKLEYIKIGKNIRITQEMLNKFIQNKKHTKQNVHEIELRFKIKNTDSLIKRIIALQGKIVEHSHIIDHWFCPFDIKTLEQKDQYYNSAKGFGLRIREYDNGYTGKIITTLEVKRLAKPYDHSVCIEHEIDIDNYYSGAKLLNLMNFKEFCTIDKQRLVLKYKNTKLVIDTIKNFKSVLEIEVISRADPSKIKKKILKIAKDIGIDTKNQLFDKSLTYEYMHTYSNF